MKLMKIFYSLLFSTLLCSRKSRKETNINQAVKKEEKKVYYESLSKNVYVNDYFDLTLAFPNTLSL